MTMTKEEMFLEDLERIAEFLEEPDVNTKALAKYVRTLKGLYEKHKSE